MIGTLAWKEYREQRAVWLTIAVLGAVSLLVISEFAGSFTAIFRFEGALNTVAVLVAFTYGLVCGSMLFAGETEGRTLVFLDHLVGARGRVWRTKVLAGSALTLTHVLLLLGALIVLPRSPLAISRFSGSAFSSFLVSMAAAGFAGFSWGLVGSALGRSVLEAVAVAAIPGVQSIALLILAVMDGAGATRWVNILASVGLAMVALALSYVAFCRRDWQRNPVATRTAARVRRVGPFAYWRVLWLTYQQGRMAVLLLGLAALILGAAMGSSHALALWPLATLLLGVCCGMGVFAGEQAGESQRFLGDQRLTIGRIWMVKTLCWLAAALGLTLVLFLTAVFRSKTFRLERLEVLGEGGLLQQIVGRDQARGELLGRVGGWTYLTLGLAYGFAMGQFFCVMARKNVVALVLAVLVAVAAAALWVPSLVSGGVQLWQVLVVPLLLLLSIRTILWAWASGRLQTFRPMLALAGGGVLAAIWMAGNFWFRTVSIPDVGEPFDVAAFRASLPTLEQNKAGPLIRRGAELLEEHFKEIDKDFSLLKPGNPGPVPGEPLQPPRTFLEQLEDVPYKGWPRDNPKLAQSLDRMFEGEWVKEFHEAARLPLGMVVDLNTVTSDTPFKFLDWCSTGGALFAARVLQLQAEGKPREALDQFAVSLAISRQLRNQALSISYSQGLWMETQTLDGMERWLRGLGPRADLLRPVLDELTRHEELLPPHADSIKADYLQVLNDREQPMRMAQGWRGSQTYTERMVFALASQVPWEHERDTRLLRAVAASALWRASATKASANGNPKPMVPNLPYVMKSDRELSFEVCQWRNLFELIGQRYYNGSGVRSLCQLRGLRLQVALALYEIENKRPAATLELLVPRDLTVVPIDPYSGKPFHYRVSKGEVIERGTGDPENLWVKEKIPAGQGILWSVSVDGEDNGGFKDAASGNVYIRHAGGADWIFLVPRWQDSKD